MATRRTVAVRIRGQEFRIRTEDDEESLHRVARLLDETFSKVEAQTGTIDSLDVALLTALNLARELLELRESRAGASPDLGPERLRALIELAESGL
jgi:cell division protein ZapA (FtsZ GTPase activity inhibitor)